MKKRLRVLVAGLTALSMVAAAGSSYVVKGGDTLSQIAEQFDTSVAAIVAANDIANPSRIYVGQELIVPGSDTYIVQAGDTLERIAHKILFGTDFPGVPDVKKNIDVIRRLQLSDEEIGRAHV